MFVISHREICMSKIISLPATPRPAVFIFAPYSPRQRIFLLDEVRYIVFCSFHLVVSHTRVLYSHVVFIVIVSDSRSVSRGRHPLT